ncbi:Na/Pi cotransporter family protein [Tepidibacillus sp. HK-1]|uniref:Na/Pi cotransporter family protein n=1 Tax=Tepidibacillus sp. HK-1 TaxID=1883407 RepID=UPI0008539F53|nr:Na/Pi symporter [Tepidibacillus sp. HK-1]GBF10133.1 Na+/Pi-cotransporter [Tepidibacillus sp. HK-1]
MREIIIPLATGMTLFLFGMKMMRLGLERISSQYLQQFLYRFTKTPYHGFFSGTIATLLLQSSSAVTVITIGLINAGLIDFFQTIGIILGTNVGTVVTVQLIAFNIGKWAVPALLVGAMLILFSNYKVRATGLFIAGFSIIFLGMDALQMISVPILRSSWLQSIVSLQEHQTMIGILVGTLMTALIQSSSATIAMTMGMIYHNGIPLDFGLAIVLGANIGTCFTAVLASMGGSIEGKQVAIAHVLLNLLGVILFYPFIPQFSEIVRVLTPYPAVQIAHFQLIFNLISSLVVLPFAKPFAYLTLLLSPKGGSPQK